jgi:hypothetical protein
MASLKASLPYLAPIFGLTTDALYERQRALVRHGVLKAIPGRGPGTGVPLSADNLATLLIAVAAVNSLSEVDHRIIEFCEATPIDARRPVPIDQCPLTGQKTFRGAVQSILLKKELVSCVEHLSIDQNTPFIFIEFTRQRKVNRSLFRHGVEPFKKGIEKMTLIRREVLASLNGLLQEVDHYEGTS